MKGFSASEAAFEGFRTLRTHPRAVGVWAILSVIGQLAFAGAFLGLFGSKFASLSQYSAASPMPPQEALKAAGSIFAAAAVMTPLGLLIGAVFLCAVLRAILRPQDKGLFYLKVSGDEWRIILFLLAWIGIGLVLYIGSVIALVIVGGVIGASATAMHVPTWIIVLISVVGVIAFFCAWVWLIVRMSLGAAMTFAEQRVRVFGSWGLTRGRFWPLFGCYLVAWIFGVVIALVGFAVSSSIALAAGQTLPFSTYAPGGATAAKSIAIMTQYFTPFGIIRILISSLFSAVANLVMFAPPAAAYRALAATPEVDVF